MSNSMDPNNQTGLSRADQILISLGSVQNAWVPYAVLVLGILLSILFAYMLYHNIRAYFEMLDTMRDSLPWLVLFFGVGFSALLAILIRAGQVLHKQSEYLIAF